MLSGLGMASGWRKWLVMSLAMLGGCEALPPVVVGEQPSESRPLYPSAEQAPEAAFAVLRARQVDAPAPFRLPELQRELPLFELTIPQSALDLFASDPYAPEQPATFRHQGTELPVMVELRGASARFFPKKSWNLDFSALRFEGRRRFALVAEYQDCTMMAEKLAYDLLQAMGVEASRARYVRLSVNGSYQGVYLEVEKVDRRFLEAHRFADRDASIYRCGWKDCEMKTWKVPYQGNWVKKTNETEGDAELQEVLEAINHTPEPELEATLEERLELTSLLRAMAMDAVMSNDYVEDSESYFIHDRVTGKWSYAPWDLNNVDARWWVGYGLGARPPVTHPLVIFSLTDRWVESIYEKRKDLYPGYLPVFSNLNTRVALNPSLRARLLETTERLLDEVFHPSLMHARVEAIYALIDPFMKSDPYIDQAKFLAGRQWMKDFVTGRSTFVREELSRLRDLRPGLAIAAVDPAQGWLELRNYGSAPAALDGMGVTTNLRQGLVQNLPGRTLRSGESVRFAQGQLGLSFSRRGEVGLFNGKSVLGMVDALYYGELPPGSHYARSSAFPERWEIR